MWCTAERSRKHPRRRFAWTRLFKKSIPAVPVLEFQASTPLSEAWGSRERQYAPPALHHAFMLAKDAHPFVEDSDKGILCHVEKQWVWSRSCGLQGLLRNIDILLNDIGTCFFPVVPCDCCKPMNRCRDWAFQQQWVGNRSCQPFSCPCSATCDSLPKRDLFDIVCLRNLSRLSVWDFEASTFYQKQVSESDSPLPPVL